MINRRWLWSVGAICGAVTLALLGQMQLEQKEPQVLLGVLCMALATWLLLRAHLMPTRTPYSRASWPALLLVLSGIELLLVLILHVQGKPTPTLAVIAWLSAICTFLAACWLFDRQHGGDLEAFQFTRDSAGELLLAGLITAFALYLRIFDLNGIPRTISGDETQMAMEAVRVIRHEHNDPFGLGWLSHPMLWFYLQAYSIRTFGHSIDGVRMLSALIGSITVATTYLLARLLYGQRIALIASLILATFHFHIHYSRTALNNIADPLFGTLALAALTVGLRTRRWFAYGLTGVIIGLALYFYHGARLFIPVVLLLGLVRLLPLVGRWRTLQNWRELRPWRALHPAGLLLAGILVAGGPLLQTFLRYPNDFAARFTIEGISLSWLEEQAGQKGSTSLGVLFEQFKRAALAFNTYADTSFHYNPGRPLLWGLGAALMLLGIFLALARMRQWEYQVPLAWFWLAVILGGVMLKNPPASSRYVTLAPVACLFIAIAADRLFHETERVAPHPVVVPNLLMIALVVYLSYTSTGFYFRQYAPNDRIGGINTYTANALLQYLRQQPPGTKIWFLGPPRMYYHGFAMLDFLADHVEGTDVIDPIQTTEDVPDADPEHNAIFAVLPERQKELDLIQDRYPGGQVRPLSWPPAHAGTLIYIYEVPHSP